MLLQASSIVYTVMPFDLLPEVFLGIFGYVDDLFWVLFCLYVQLEP